MTGDLKYVKIFEQLTFEQKRKLSPGKQRALTRGDDLISVPQYAACFMNAKENLARQEDTMGHGDNAMTRAALRMTTRRNDQPPDYKEVSASQLSVYLGIKPPTAQRIVSKFKLLLSGNREGTEGDKMYPEIIKLYHKFRRMQPERVERLALTAVNYSADDSNLTRYLEQTKKSSKASAEKRRTFEESIFEEAIRLFRSLKERFDTQKAARLTLTKMAMNHEDLGKDHIKEIVVSKLAKDPIIMKAFKEADKPAPTAQGPEQ